MLTVGLFGRVRLASDGKSVPFAGRPKVAPLLAYLLLNCRRPASRDIVAFALWPDAPEETARGNLRRHLHYLREALPPSGTAWVVADAKTVCWNPSARVKVDVADFESFAADPATLDKAIKLYGELLEGCEDEWLFGPRERLHTLYVQSLWELVRRARGRRDRSAASDYLGRILADDPWREDAVRALMVVHFEGGDSSSALQLCAEFEERLKREMKAALMPETAALRHAIERGNPLPAIPIAPGAHASIVATTDLPFEGRTDEVLRLGAIWQSALDGSGALALILGEAGIGKTRLVSEFAVQADAMGARVFWGTTSSPETIPYQPVTEILRAALGFIELSRRETYDLDVLARVIPELQNKESPTDPGGAPPAEKLFDVVADLFIELSRPRPALLVLEDLHAAGQATIAMLEHIAQRCADNPMLILATLREEEPRSADILGRLRRPRKGTKPWTIAVGPLSEIATRSIAAQSLGKGADAGRVAARAGGHPLFLAQLVYAAQALGSGFDALPAGLRESIDARTERLSPQASFLLRAAAVAGSAFDLEIVGESLGWSENQVSAAADELIARRLIRETARSQAFDYEFAHDLIASAAYDSLQNRERRRLHRRTGRACERWYASRLEELAAYMARHFELGSERGPAASYYLAAAKAAARKFAHADVLAYARRTLELRPSSNVDRYDALCVVEEALDIIGNRAEQAACLHDLEQIAEEIGDPASLCEVLRRRESFHRFLREYDAARLVLARLHRFASGNARWEAIALRDEAALLYNSGSQPDAYDVGARAVARAGGACDSVVLLSTLTLQADIAASLGRQEEALTLLQRAKETATLTDSAMLLMRALCCEMTVLTRFQAWPSVVRCGPALLDLAGKVGRRDTTADVHTMLGGALSQLFDVGSARRHLHSAIELYQQCDINGLFVAYNDLATVELEVGDLENAALSLDKLKALAVEAPSPFSNACTRLVACELAAQRAEIATAIELAEDAVAAAIAHGNHLFEAEALRCKGASLRAIGRAGEAVAALERCVAIFNRLQLEASVNRAEAELSLAYALAGDATRASALIDGALAPADSEPADSHQVLWPLAEALQLLGRTAQARAMLRRAFAAFEARRKRLRSPRDKTAFSRIPANAALERAYASVSVDALESNAGASTPRGRRGSKTQTSHRLQPPAHCP